MHAHMGCTCRDIDLTRCRRTPAARAVESAPNELLPHDVPLGIAHEDVVRPDRRVPARVRLHENAARAAQGVVAQRAPDQGRIRPLDHLHPTIPIGPYITAFQTPLGCCAPA